MRSLLVAALALGAGPALAVDAPFLGTWDCGGYGVLKITAEIYDFGEPVRIKSVTRDGDAYVITMTDDYMVMVDVRGDEMSWLSGESGDAFECRRQ